MQIMVEVKDFLKLTLTIFGESVMIRVALSLTCMIDL